MPFTDFPLRSVRCLIEPSPLPSKIIPFYVVRNADMHGNTGRGIVAEGLVFSDGRCVMRWLHKIASTAFFDSVEDLMAIHGHSGKTVILLWQ